LLTKLKDRELPLWYATQAIEYRESECVVWERGKGRGTGDKETRDEEWVLFWWRGEK
jgi:hypothetical protein